MNHDKGRELFFLAQDARKAGRHAAAEAYLREALQHAPGRESLRTNLCGALIDQGKHAEALGLCQDLVRDFPASAVGWHRLSLCQFERRQFAEALTSVGRSLSLQPDNVDALCHRIAILLELRDNDAALETGRRAIALAPQNASLHTALGVIHTARREFEQTLQCHTRALQLTPDDMDRRWNLALVQLMLGDFRNGWLSMEARWSNSAPVKVRYSGAAPCWDGSASLQNRSILVWAEQGLGDVIQFSRFIPLLAGSCGQLIFQVPEALATLMTSLAAASGAEPSIRFLAEGAPLPPHDCHLPLLSVPRFCNDDAIPAVARLTPPPARLEAWRERLSERRRPRVGLMWQGNLNNFRGVHRSLNLPQLADVLALPLDFYCVSNTLSRSDQLWLRENAPSVCHFTHDIGDFSDTAALVAQLDLVVTIDTSIAHLAPALGIPTWVLLSHSADWRWGVDSQSPWYPQSRLFRQHKLGEWRPPLQAVQAALMAHFDIG